MLALACVVSAPAGAQPVCRPVTLVTSAYPAELSAVLAKSSGVRDRWTDDGVTFYRTEIRGKPIVAAMTGVGIVNATRTANASFADLTCSRHGLRIARIVFSGTAGGLPPAGIGDVAVPATWYLTRTGRALPADPTLLAAARAAHPHLNHVTDGVNPLAPCGCKLPWVPPIDLHREPRVVVGGKGLSRTHTKDSRFRVYPAVAPRPVAGHARSQTLRRLVATSIRLPVPIPVYSQPCSPTSIRVRAISPPTWRPPPSPGLRRRTPYPSSAYAGSPMVPATRITFPAFR